MNAYHSEPDSLSSDAYLPKWAQGFTMPIGGASVPDAENLLPNARRMYRNGTHEGIDIFSDYGTPVMAAKDGHVLYISGYETVSSTFRSHLLKISRMLPETPLEILRVLHGRQVILEHGLIDGGWLVTVYSHLSEVDEGLAVGDLVKKGEILGYVGNSGTDSEGAENGSHLHFEVRVNGHYLGEGMTPKEAGKLYRTILGDGSSPLDACLLRHWTSGLCPNQTANGK